MLLILKFLWIAKVSAKNIGWAETKGLCPQLWMALVTIPFLYVPLSMLVSHCLCSFLNMSCSFSTAEWSSFVSFSRFKKIIQSSGADRESTMSFCQCPKFYQMPVVGFASEVRQVCLSYTLRHLFALRDLSLSANQNYYRRHSRY